MSRNRRSERESWSTGVMESSSGGVLGVQGTWLKIHGDAKFTGFSLWKAIGIGCYPKKESIRHGGCD
jgi:hypothetical protein